MLHPKLREFRDVNFIGRMNRVFKKVTSELEAYAASDLSVEVISNPDASFLRLLFTFQVSYDANQWVFVGGEACGYFFRLMLPFRNGVTLPYQLEIILNTKAELYATLHPWITSRGRWYTEPLDYRKGKALRRLRLPGVAWTHASGGLRFRLRNGGSILPPDGDVATNRWIVNSAYQGFIVVRPKVVKYLQAAARLDALIRVF